MADEDPNFGRVLPGHESWFGAPPSKGRGLQGGGGHGPFDPMEARVAKLESDVGHIQRDIADLKVDVRALRTDVGTLNTTMATIQTEIRHLPSKGFVVTSTLAALAVLGALVVFQGHIQSWVGPKPPASGSVSTEKPQ